MSKKCKYAFKSLIQLGKNYNKGFSQTSKIAESENIPKEFLEHILLDLKRAGYVGSKPGFGGGYYLIKHPKTISIKDIYRFLMARLRYYHVLR